jgi:hypothetical protein
MITRKDNKFLQQRNGKDNKFSGENLILMERCSRIALFFKKVRPTQVKRRTTQHEQSVDVPSTKLSTVSYRFCPVVGMGRVHLEEEIRNFNVRGFSFMRWDGRRRFGGWRDSPLSLEFLNLFAEKMETFLSDPEGGREKQETQK